VSAPRPPWIDPFADSLPCPGCGGTGHLKGRPEDECALCLGAGHVSGQLALRYLSTLPGEDFDPPATS